MADLSQPGDIAIAKVKDSDDMLIVAGNRLRVQVPCRGVAELVGKARNELRMGDIRKVAEELLAKPSLAYGRIETCAELHDPDRRGKTSSGSTMTDISDPYGLENDASYRERSDEWKPDPPEGGD